MRRTAPRLYYVHPLVAGPLERWSGLLDHIAGLGFTQVVAAPLFAPGPSGDVFITADHERLHPALGGQPADEAIAQAVQACRRAGLSLILDVVVDRVATGSGLARTHPDWVRTVHPEGDLPDPRRPPRERAVAALALERPEFAAGATEWWKARLDRLLQAGVEGFRFLGLERVPPNFWPPLLGALQGSKRRALALGWTPGVDAQRLRHLEGTGFDAVFLSTCWWDLRSDWYAEEHERLRRVARPLAPVEAPFGPRMAAAHASAVDTRRSAERLLRVAAGTGCGLLMPMGFEFGARDLLHPDRGTPQEWQEWRAAGTDLCPAVRDVNAELAAEAVLALDSELRPVSAPDADAVALLRGNHPDMRVADQGLLVVANAQPDRPVVLPLRDLLARTPEFTTLDAAVSVSGAMDVLRPAEVRWLRLCRAAPVLGPATPSAELAARWPRIAIEAIQPTVEEGRFPVKRVVGEALRVEADIFADGHTALAASLLWRAEGEENWQERRMQPVANDRWAAEFHPVALGRHWYTVAAWIDEWASFADGLRKKVLAGRDVRLEVREGIQLLERIAAAAPAEARSDLQRLRAELDRLPDAGRIERLLEPETARRVDAGGWRPFIHRREPPLPLQCEPLAAAYASWYELFPRSQSGDERRHGTFDDVIARLPAIRAMGFDVLYFPPIHPIGRSHRKGRNNALQASPGEPGSPYAIGSAEGGHDAIHPELGTLEDFRRLRAAAAAQGLQLALDFAIQCSPDHPWLREHPGWFAWRPDGTIAYAENPPKKYEDIVNVDFFAEAAVPGLWEALRDVVLFWVTQGVTLFRVDNPHTKPLSFWEWLIDEVRGRHPEVVFLSEAFTRPKPMQRLAKVGFSQSYTYFTWRHGKGELTEYFAELSEGPAREYFRPHLFVNTPDINPFFLQSSGRAGFLQRAALAATLSGLWGVFNGFELCEARAVPGKEEYWDSEKYQLRAWDWDRPGNIIREITQLNRIRRANPALHSHLGLRFYNAWNDHVLYYGRMTPQRDNFLLIAVNLDPFRVQEAEFEVPLWEWGRDDDASIAVEDLWHGQRFIWRGKRQRLRLDPAELPFAIWRLRPGVPT